MLQTMFLPVFVFILSPHENHLDDWFWSCHHGWNKQNLPARNQNPEQQKLGCAVALGGSLDPFGGRNPQNTSKRTDSRQSNP